MVRVEECSVRVINVFGVTIAWITLLWIVYKIGKISQKIKEQSK